MKAEDILFKIRVCLVRKLCKAAHIILSTSDFPYSVQNANEGWKFNNKWKQPVMGEHSESEQS